MQTPAPGPLSETFFEATAVARPDRPALAADRDCEIVIAGGGTAGLSVALELARRGRDVVVLEAGRVGDGASGRCAGFVGPGYCETTGRIIARVGEDHARALWQISAEGAMAVRHLIAETAMPGVELAEGQLLVFRTAGEAEAARLAERLLRWGTPARAWPRERLRQTLLSASGHAALHLPDSFHLHPLNYTLGLAGAVEAAGGRIFENTPVVGADLDGVRKRVETPRARLRAHHVVACGAAGMAGAFPDIGQGVYPVVTCLGVTAPLGSALHAAIGFRGAIADNRRLGAVYKVVGDRLLWGCGLTTLAPSAEALKRALAADIAATYPQLAGADIAHAWTTTLGQAVHSMPVIGQLAPGLWLATAFGGHGIAAAAAAGRLIAAGILDGDDRWRLFIPFGLVPANTIVDRLLTETATWSMRLRDRIDEAAMRRAGQHDPARAARRAIAKGPAAALPETDTPA